MKSISKMLALTVMLEVLSMRAATTTTPSAPVEDQPHMQPPARSTGRPRQTAGRAVHWSGTALPVTCVQPAFARGSVLSFVASSAIAAFSLVTSPSISALTCSTLASPTVFRT